MENERKAITNHSRNNRKVENIIHYVNKEAIIKQHEKQMKGKATGIDKITKEMYDENLYANVGKLIESMKKLSYKPLPVKRAYIPKANGKTRPLGIPAYEDKLVQGIFAELLNEVYECKFLDCSYGFRPNRNCHQAIREINQRIMINKVNYILDCDIKGFFDNVNHDWLMKFLENDIQDKVFLRYIKRFLISGYMELGRVCQMDKGTPQGGLISPILGNVYLHYVLDLWIEKIVKPELKGEIYLVRYADDFVIMFQYEEEAKKVYDALVKRLAKYGLEVAEEKTRILPFGRYKGNKETFNFLGFMHYNGKTRTGKYTVGHKIDKKKKKQKKQEISNFVKENRQMNIFDVIGEVNKKLIGLYAYYGINGMFQELISIYRYAYFKIFLVYRKRSQRTNLTIEYYENILKYHPIEQPKIYKNIWCWNV